MTRSRTLYICPQVNLFAFTPALIQVKCHNRSIRFLNGHMRSLTVNSGHAFTVTNELIRHIPTRSDQPFPGLHSLPLKVSVTLVVRVIRHYGCASQYRSSLIDPFLFRATSPTACIFNIAYRLPCIIYKHYHHHWFIYYIMAYI